jgi:Putative porin
MSLRNRLGVGSVAALLLMAPAVQAQAADDATEQKNLEVLRNTVVNLLQALVDKGLMTREQADALVKQAQDKAAADAAALAARNAAQAKEDEGAVRVPYVPQIVKDQISQQVAEQVKPAVVAEVVQEAKTEKWGVPGALPEWLSRVSVFGDVTLRGQADLFPHDNSFQELLDYNAVNTAGGISAAAYPFLDTSEDRYRLRVRARLGVRAELSDYVEAVVRLASGSLTQVAGSESQTLGTYGNRYTVGIDEAFIAWNTNTRDQLSLNTLEGGRLANPWFSPTELVYARDLTFEGVADTARFGWGEGASDRSHIFLTAGAFPMLEVPTEAEDDKWMLGTQFGANLRFGSEDHLHAAVAYYDFLRVTGVQNPPYSTQYNFTAPAFVQWGNTMFDIANNPANPNVNLFGLAAQFREADVAAQYVHGLGRYSLSLSGEVVRNIGYNLETVELLSGQNFSSPQDKGYVGEVSFGDPTVDELGRWRAAVGYRYVQADALLDAWTDADFHEGGTNAEGYYLWASYGFTHNVWARLRYMSANEITGPRYGLDIFQLDFNARF